MMNLRDRHLWLVVINGLALGLAGVLLSVWGNPANSGICVSCFIENSAGALGLHGNPRMAYLRPELPGFVLGAFLAATAGREFSSRGGSNPLARVLAGIFLIFGCAVFIGCPIKLVLRLAAGDLTAVAGVMGLCCGIWAGVRGSIAGVTIGDPPRPAPGSGLYIPAGFLLLLVFFLLRPRFLVSATTGSAAEAAPWVVSLAAGLLLGAVAQRSRFCITGGIRDVFLLGRRSYLFWGLVAFILAAVLLNMGTGRFHPAMEGQPGAHLEHLWSFLGMGLVGWLSVLMGGCPFRQLVRAGGGDVDAGLVVVGMFLGGGLVQAWGVAATAAGVSMYGKAGILSGFAFILILSLLHRERVAADGTPALSGKIRTGN